MLSDNKPLTETILLKIYADIWDHKATMSCNFWDICDTEKWAIAWHTVNFIVYWVLFIRCWFFSCLDQPQQEVSSLSSLSLLSRRRSRWFTFQNVQSQNTNLHNPMFTWMIPDDTMLAVATEAEAHQAGNWVNVTPAIKTAICKDIARLWALMHWLLNSSLPRQNGHHFAEDIFKCIFVNEKLCILIKISLNFAPLS